MDVIFPGGHERHDPDSVIGRGAGGRPYFETPSRVTALLSAVRAAGLLQRNAKQEPVEQGGWSVFHTYWSGLDMLNPAVNSSIRGNGRATSRGWPTSPALETLRDAWLRASDEPAQRRIAAEMQRQAFVDLPYIPLGQILARTAYATDIADVRQGFAMFWSLRRGQA